MKVFEVYISNNIDKELPNPIEVIADRLEDVPDIFYAKYPTCTICKILEIPFHNDYNDEILFV